MESIGFVGGEMKLIRMGVATAIALSLASCGKTTTECTSADSQNTAISAVRDRLQRQVEDKVKKDDGSRLVGLSLIKSAIQKLTITLDDIRTSKTDPNSTKRWCAGSLHFQFPASVIDDAGAARSRSGLNPVDDLADKNSVERTADGYTVNVDFTVQPSDDGQKIFAEVENGSGLLEFGAEVISSALLRPTIDKVKGEEDAATSAQAAQEAAVLAEQRAANVNAAKVDNQLANQTIAAVWKGLDGETRSRLLLQQRAWIRKKDADCKVEAAGASVDPGDQEVARLNCNTRSTRERTGWLQQQGGQAAQDASSTY